MWKRILLATDGSESATEAARFLAQMDLPSETDVRIACVLDPFVECLLSSAQPSQRHHAERVIAGAEAALVGSGFHPTAWVRAGDADHQLVLAAREWPADLIVLGHRGLTGLTEFLLGSVARNVAREAPCSVLVVRGAAREVRSVVAAVDGSPHAQKALDDLAALPLPRGTRIRLVQVVRPAHALAGLAAVSDDQAWVRLRDLEEEQKQRAGAALETAAVPLAARGWEVTTGVRVGDPAGEVLQEAEAATADLVVAGARGSSLLEHLLLGSVADRLLRRAPCSVLLVR
jgi:nucleotide-binding universal stress UspA family protein